MTRVLPQGEIHLWQANLMVDAGRKSSFYETLSSDERERAARFRFERHRNAFIAGRGMLRELLASYCGLSPTSLAFDYGEFGKPTLRNNDGIYFNASHSEDWIVFVLAREQRLGVDIEQVREIPEAEQIAAQFLSGAEGSGEFFTRWTRHEAYVKALGGGLGSDTPTFQPTAWSMFDWEPSPGYVGAIAIYGRDWTLSHRK